MAGKLRPSPSASATAFAPGTVKRGNDGNKYVIVVASNGVPRWQKAKSGFAKPALRKTGPVKKLGMKKATKKPTSAMKVKLPLLEKKTEEEPKSAEQLAIDVCRRLTKGELRISDLGKSPGTKGYVLLRDFANKHMRNNANYSRFQKRYCSPADEEEDMEAMDPVLTVIAYFPAEIIDGMKSVDEMRILFSDEKDKKFFSLAVVNGYYRGDSANQFYHDFLIKKKHTPAQIVKAMEASQDYKIMENLMVKYNGPAVLQCEHEH